MFCLFETSRVEDRVRHALPPPNLHVLYFSDMGSGGCLVLWLETAAPGREPFQILCKSLLALLFLCSSFLLVVIALLPFLPFKCDLRNRVRAKESRLGVVCYLVGDRHL